MVATTDRSLCFTSAAGMLDELRAAIRRAKGDDLFAPVWVWAPHARAAQAIQQRLARADGVLNLQVMTENDLMFALLGAEGLALPRLGSAMQRELARQVLRKAQPPMSGHRGSNVVDAFVYALRELRERSLGEREVIEESADALARELVRLYDLYRTLIEGTFYDDQDLRGIATAMDVVHPPVVSVVTEPPEWYANDLLQKVMKQPGSSTIAVEAGERELDDTLRVWLWGVERALPEMTLPFVDSMPQSENIVVAPDVMAEVDLAIAAVLKAGEGGVAFADIAVLFPEPSPHWALLIARLQAAGIPFRGRMPGQLFQTPLGRFVLQTMEVLHTDFAFDALESWFSESYVVDPATGQRPEIGDWIAVARRARVVGGSGAGGASEIISRLRLFAESMTRPTDERLRIAALSCAALVQDLSETVGDVPQTWFEWASLMQRCINRFVGTSETRRHWPREQQVVANAVESRLKSLESLDAVSTGRVDAEVVIDTLVSALSTAMPTSNDTRGVLIGSFSDAVCAQFAHVVLCGLNEGLVPAADTRGALQVALRVPGQEKAGERQRRAFLHALMSSTRRTLLCARTDQRSQRERLPSPWLLERASLLAGRRVGATELVVSHPEWPWLTVVPSFSALLGRDAVFGVDAFHQLGSLSRWANAGADVCDHPLLAMNVQTQRAVTMLRSRDGDELTRFDGLVGALPALQESLQTVMTPTRFEAWATCPARYFYSTVLQVFEREEDDKQLGLSGRARGTAVHDVLERFVGAVPPRTRPTQRWTSKERAVLHELGDVVFAEALQSGVTQAGLLHEIERRRLHEELDRFLEFDESLREQYGVVTVGAELAFGQEEAQEVVIERPNGVPVRFRGRIDRVDRSPDGLKAAVIDYKTGKKSYLRGFKQDPVVGGQRVQLAVYGAAVEAGESVVVTSMYWCTSDSSVRDPLVAVPFDETTKQRLRDVVDGVATGIESGFFAAIPGKEDRDSFTNCRMCAFDNICLADRDETWDRKSSDPTATSWHSLDVTYVADQDVANDE